MGNNSFDGNHWDTQYFGYGGGQVLVEDNGGGFLEDINITGNIITAGPSVNAYGIEFANFDNAPFISGEIIWNVIEDHSLPAIEFHQRSLASDIRQMNIANNDLINNAQYQGSQVHLNSHAFVDISANVAIFGGNTRSGNFTGTPRTCALNGSPVCAINVQWDSYGISNPNVYVRSATYGSSRSLFASGASGTQSAAWIPAEGVVFELVSGTSLSPVATIFVRGI